MENKEIEDMEVVDNVVENQEKGGQETKKCCKKEMLYLMMCGILTVAVGVLFVLHFSQTKTKPLPVRSADNSQAVIVTVNIDSVTEHFELVSILKNDLEQEKAKYEAELKPKYAALEEKYTIYMTNLQSNVLTQTQKQNAEKQLMTEKNRLDELSLKYSEIMSKKELSVQNEITDSLKNAAKRINEAGYNANYIFAISTGSAILYSNEIYDITQEVIKEMNDVYKKSTK